MGDGEDHFAIGAEEFRGRLNPSHSKFANEDVILLAEQGYLMLAKLVTNDLVLQLYDDRCDSFLLSVFLPVFL
ncbi:MAG: hypothetical protein LCH89_07930 [Proteobacteria bacterium]|nr:hypothetical protein [Pseudomonadota bacterium]